MLPTGAIISRTDATSVRVRTGRLLMQISTDFEGFSAVLPDRFEEFYLGVSFDDIDSYIVNLRIDVKFAWWALFTPAGWEYYRWLDSFVEEMGKTFSFERFITDVGWHAALTAHVIERAAAVEDRPAVARILRGTSERSATSAAATDV